MVTNDRNRKHEDLDIKLEYDPEFLKRYEESLGMIRDISIGMLASLGITVATLVGLAVAFKIMMLLMDF